MVAQVVDRENRHGTKRLLHFQVPLLNVIHLEVVLRRINAWSGEGVLLCRSRKTCFDRGDRAASGDSIGEGGVVCLSIRPQIGGGLGVGEIVLRYREGVLRGRILGYTFERAARQAVIEDTGSAANYERVVHDLRVVGKSHPRLPLKRLEAREDVLLIEQIRLVVRDGSGVDEVRELSLQLREAVQQAADVALVL